MILKDYKNCLTLSYDQFVTKYNIHDDQIDHDVRYEKLTHVARIALGDNQWFYFKDGELKMIYLSDDVQVEKIWNEFKNTTKANPEKVVRSRAGKTSNQRIFSQQGFTASTHGAAVDFIEIYPPQTLNDYLANIYDEPGPFIR